MRLILICKFPKYCIFKIKLLTGRNARCLVNQVISDICLFLLHLFKQPQNLTWFLYKLLFKQDHKMQHSTLSISEARHLFIGQFLQPSSCDTQIRPCHQIQISANTIPVPSHLSRMYRPLSQDGLARPVDTDLRKSSHTVLICPRSRLWGRRPVALQSRHSR